MRRHLVLRKDTLTALHTDELAAVGGGQELPTRGCVADPSVMVPGCDSLLRPCISHTCTR